MEDRRSHGVLWCLCDGTRRYHPPRLRTRSTKCRTTLPAAGLWFLWIECFTRYAWPRVKLERVATERKRSTDDGSRTTRNVDEMKRYSRRLTPGRPLVYGGGGVEGVRFEIVFRIVSMLNEERIFYRTDDVSMDVLTTTAYARRNAIIHIGGGHTH